MPVAQRCAECRAPLVAVAEPVLEGKPRPRALLGVSVVVDYGPAENGRAGGELVLCIGCGGSREIERGLAMAPAPEPVKPAGRGKPTGKPAPAPAPQRPRKTFT